MRVWSSVDFGIHEGPGTPPLWMLKSHCAVSCETWFIARGTLSTWNHFAEGIGIQICCVVPEDLSLTSLSIVLWPWITSPGIWWSFGEPADSVIAVDLLPGSGLVVPPVFLVLLNCVGFGPLTGCLMFCRMEWEGHSLGVQSAQSQAFFCS